MPRGLLPPLLVLAALLLAGCTGGTPVDVAPYLPVVSTEQGREAQVAFYLNSTFTFKQDQDLAVELPETWTYRLSEPKVTLPGHKGRFVVVNVTPPADAADGEAQVKLHVGKSIAAARVNVTDLGPATRTGAGLNLTWVHWDRNGTLLGWHEPLLDPAGLRVGPNATREGGPLRAYLRAPGEVDVPPAWAAAGYVRLPDEAEARLLQAKVGEAVLVESTEGLGSPFPPAGGAPGARVLLRVVDLREAPPEPAVSS